MTRAQATVVIIILLATLANVTDTGAWWSRALLAFCVGMALADISNSRDSKGRGAS